MNKWQTKSRDHRPQKKWVDDIKKVAGKQWIRQAQDRENLKIVGAMLKSMQEYWHYETGNSQPYFMKSGRKNLQYPRPSQICSATCDDDDDVDDAFVAICCEGDC